MQEENNKIIVLEQDKLISKVSNSLRIADKLLPIKEEPKLIPYRKGNKWGFCNSDKQIVVDCVFDQTFQFINNFAKVKIGENYGYANCKGELIIGCEFEQGPFLAMDFTKDEIVLVRKDKKHYFLNKNGERINDCNYEYASQFKNGLAAVKHNNMFGYIDTKGNQVINYKYESASSFSYFNKFANVRLDEKSMIIDKNESKIIDFPYTNSYPSYVSYDSPNEYEIIFKVIRDNHNHGFVDKDFNEIIPTIFIDSHYFLSEGLVGLWSNRFSAGFLDYNGNEIIPFKYTDVNWFNEGLAGVKLNDKWGVINKNGDLVISFYYDEIGIFSNGLAPVKIKNKWGFINKIGQIVVEAIYDEVIMFNKGLARVQLNNKIGYIDINGELVIDLKYNWHDAYNTGAFFIDNLKIVGTGPNMHGYINTKGTEFWED